MDIPQTVTQTLLKVLMFGMDVNQAISSPRYVLRYRDNSIPYPPGTVVEVEKLPESTVRELENMGHIIGRHTPIDRTLRAQ